MLKRAWSRKDQEEEIKNNHDSSLKKHFKRASIGVILSSLIIAPSSVVGRIYKKQPESQERKISKGFIYTGIGINLSSLTYASAMVYLGNKRKRKELSQLEEQFN